MSLPRGTKLGPYELLDVLGAGGMGEVYKARDTRLDRIVAVKVLAQSLAGRPDLRQRLEREARAASSLNHPHICAVYDIGQQGDTDFLVLEYLEGETLANRLKKGALPHAAALRYAVEIAGALDGAHRGGIVHRDLKPANIMLTSSGAKLLDFGLAKFRPAGRTADDDSTALLTGDLTSPGTVLGTFQYMSPEQLEGKEADARSDVFAFGVVLYEMLTGKKAFRGASQASLIAAILTSEPAAVSALQSAAGASGAALDHVVQTCLAKDPDARWQSAGDLRRELQWIAGMAPAKEASAPRSTARFAWWAALAALGVAGVALGLYTRPRAAEQPSMRLSIATGAKLPSDLRISPDGTKVAYTAQDAEGKRRLWVRPLDRLEAQPIPGTEGANSPFWSPDSRYLAFFDPYYRGHLKKVDLSGGEPQTICEAIGAGGSWAPGGEIIFISLRNYAIYRVTSSGGVPVEITPPASGIVRAHPVFLPDGKHFLYVERANTMTRWAGTAKLLAGSLDAKEAKPILETGFGAEFAPGPSANAPGHLLFLRDGILMAQDFDPVSLQLRGRASRILDAVATDVPSSSADFSVSRTGLLVYNAAVHDHELQWVDRSGRLLARPVPVTRYAHPTLSPDGTQAVYEEGDPKDMTVRLWTLAIDRGDVSLFDGEGILPVFFPDGSAVAFLCTEAGKLGYCRKSRGGAGNREMFWEAGDARTVVDFTRDGRFLSFIDQTRGRELWILPLTGERRPFPFYPGGRLQRGGVFSPDGKWIAYVSSETGDYEVYVQPFPATGGKWKISANGGAQPRWRGDGREIYFRTFDGNMMAAEVNTAGGFAAKPPQLLFRSTADVLYPNLAIAYAVRADGQRFLINAAAEGTSSPITVVTNWAAAR